VAGVDVEAQRLVSVPRFWLGRFPITQAQWQVVAGWPQLERELDPDPARFKGADRPVERVSWHDAQEFCRRLSKRTGRHYSLPSEALWEYACRAGSTTPFHFGPTISSDLANYKGTYTYASGSKGDYREHTTPVGCFPANAWGLHDMHGNVWEWCLDRWHPSPRQGPSDGRPWLEPAKELPPEGRELRLLRGGSWFDGPRGCRSAFRGSDRPGGLNVSVGFRVCCLPPGLPSWPLNP
jgi:formylglycine-generating enzyme required for sulfatase activity